MFGLRRKNRFQKSKKQVGKKASKQTRQLSLAQKTLLKQLGYGVALFSTIALIAYAVWHIARLETFTLKNVEVIGGQTIDPDTIRARAETLLEGDYFKIIPRRFTYFYPKLDIESQLLSIERVKNVQVERTSRNTLTIVYEEYVPYALWCDIEENEQCLFIDSSGYAYAGAPELRGGAFVRYETIGSSPERNVYGFDKEEIEFTRGFIDMLEERIGVYVISVAVDTEGDAYFNLSGGGQLIVSMRENKEGVVENLITILSSEEFRHIEPGNFQYIDLRFGNKIFVNEELESETSSSTEEIEIEASERAEP